MEMNTSKIFKLEKNNFDVDVSFDLCTKLYIVNVSKGKLKFRDEFANYDNAFQYTLEIIEKIQNL